MSSVLENAQEHPPITSLDLSNSQIKIYTALTTYPDLTELNFSHNALSGTLATEIIAQLTKLRVLDLSHNRLTSVAALATLRETLHSLAISHNRLRTLGGIDACYKLHTLKISHNLLTEQSGLTKLETLRMLRILDFRGNEALAVAAEIRQLLPFVTTYNGKRKDTIVVPKVGFSRWREDVREETTIEETEIPKVNAELEKFILLLEESIKRKERLLKKLPVVF
jgi:hypothetical protein